MRCRGVFCFLLAFVLFVKSSSQCPALETSLTDVICICDEQGNGWSFTCVDQERLNLSFSFTLVVDTSITIECGESTPDYKSLFEQTDFKEIQSFIFKSCPLPNISYGEIIPYNKDYPPVQIKIENKQDNGTIDASLFTNISEDLTSLILSKNGIEILPESLFESFSRLKFLSLSDNKLRTLPDEVFQNSTNLLYLEIAHNLLEKLPENVFQGLSKLEKLYLYKNKLRELPEKLFKNLSKLAVLDLADNQLMLLPSKIFDDLSQLIHIRLRGNWLVAVPPTLFRHCLNLQEIDLSLNKFMEPLPESLLYGLNKLDNFNINNCNVTYIYETFFAHCPNITSLNLENINLRKLPENIFKNNSMLKELNLNYNVIDTLPRNLFPNQKNLQKFSIYGNNVSVIPNGLFEHARSVKTLELGRNHIRSVGGKVFQHLPYLERIDLRNNNLTSFNLSQNENIRYIDLSYNNLPKMPNFKWLQHLKLETLNLEHNKITFFSLPVLYSQIRNPTINIAHNNIKTVNVQDVLINDFISSKSPEEYEPYSKTVISLNSNPFVCDCHLYDFYDYVRKSNQAGKKSVKFTIIQNLTCAEPPHLNNKPIVQLKPDQFRCTLTENCAPPCSCYNRTKDNANIVNCSNHQLKELPTSVPQNTSILYFQKNSLSRMEGFNHQMWENLTDLFLDNNQITSLDNWNIPLKLKNVSLVGNRIKLFSSSLMNFASHAKEFHLNLRDNPWICNCTAKSFKKWLTEHYQIVHDAKNVICANRLKRNGTLIRLPILSMPDDAMCPANDWPYKVQLITVTTICAILALLLFVVSVLYYRNKQTVIAYVYIHMHNVFMCFFNEEDIDEDKKFDAFVAYSSSDRDVAITLIEELENKEPHFELCIHERNWVPGYPISVNIINSVQRSRRTILVISKEFLKSIWFQVEFQMAYYQMLEDKIDRVIIIVKGELPPKESLDKDLQYLLSTKTYLLWGEKWFWEKLKYAMPHKRQARPTEMMAVKDQPASEKIKYVDNQIAILSSSSNKATGKVQEVVQNGTNRALNLVNKEASFKK